MYINFFRIFLYFVSVSNYEFSHHASRLKKLISSAIHTIGKFVLNLTRFTCPKQSTQIIMLIWHKINMLESNTNIM